MARHLLPELRDLLADGQKLLLHGEELGDRVCGIVTGYLVWSGSSRPGPQAITLIERMVERQLGPVGRQIVADASTLKARA